MMLIQPSGPSPTPPIASGALARSCSPRRAMSLTGCMVGPDYSPPSTAMPTTYGELPGTLRRQQARERRRNRMVASLQRRRTRLARGACPRRERQPQGCRGQGPAGPVRTRSGETRFCTHGSEWGASALRFRGSQSAIGLPAADLEEQPLSGRIRRRVDRRHLRGTDGSWSPLPRRRQGADSLRRGVVLMVAAETARAYMELRGAHANWMWPTARSRTNARPCR
jgi:hypothetical protein